MKSLSVIFAVILFLGCNGQAQHSSQPDVPTTTSNLKDLRWELNNVLSMQLPSTQPDSLGGKVYRKSYSFNTLRSEAGMNLEVPELWRTVEKDSTFSGSRYKLDYRAIDLENIRIVSSPDGKYTAILIPAKPDSSFLHQPYRFGEERRLNALTLGWYDRVQDKTLERCYIHLVQFLRKMGE